MLPDPLLFPQKNGEHLGWIGKILCDLRENHLKCYYFIITINIIYENTICNTVCMYVCGYCSSGKQITHQNNISTFSVDWECFSPAGSWRD